MKNDIIIIIIIIITIIININMVVGSDSGSTSLPVHNALKLSDVLGQMSANSSKIILPATQRMENEFLNQARFKSFRFEVLSNLSSFVPDYSSFYITNQTKIVHGKCY